MTETEHRRRDYDSTLARMAGNIAAGLVTVDLMSVDDAALRRLALTSVRLARFILEDVRAGHDAGEKKP